MGETERERRKEGDSVAATAVHPLAHLALAKRSVASRESAGVHIGRQRRRERRRAEG